MPSTTFRYCLDTNRSLISTETIVSAKGFLPDRKVVFPHHKLSWPVSSHYCCSGIAKKNGKFAQRDIGRADSSPNFLVPSRQKLNIACRPSHANVVEFEEVEALLYIPCAMYLTTLRSGIQSQFFLLSLDDVLGFSNSR